MSVSKTADEGSIPSTPAIYILLLKVKKHYMYAQIAQSVEQRTENPRVGGSIPPLGTRSVIREICYGLLLFLRVQDFFCTFLEYYIKPR